MTRKKLITMSVASAIMVTAMGVHAPSVEAKSLRLSSKRVTLTVGKSKTIKVRGAKKVKWKVAWGSKCIRLSNKKKTSVKIIAKKAGSAKIQAKAGKKKISCRVTVSPKTVILNVNKVDKATVKKVHETLSKGNTLRVRIQGGNRSQRVHTMDNLRDAVGKYNEYGVLPQISSTNGTKSYNEWKADKELAGQYKWGLLLVKDAVKNYKEIMTGQQTIDDTIKDYIDGFKSVLYAKGISDYPEVFEQVTGVTPEIYKECQTKKTSKVQYYYKCGETGHMGLCPNNPGITEIKDWYYATDKDGNLIEEREIVTDDTIALGVEDDYGTYLSTTNINNYMFRIGNVWKIPYSNVVFHYEPLKVDMDKVNSEIQKEKQKELNNRYALIKAEEEANKNWHEHNDPICTKKFCDLSSVLQMLTLQPLFSDGDDYTTYYVPDLNKIRAGGGAEGLRLAYQRKWMGVCDDYADLEMTIYDLFGLEAEKIVCHKCNHAWTAVKLTNSKGKTFYTENDYGIDICHYYTVMPDVCLKHNKNTGIKPHDNSVRHDSIYN